MKSPELLSNEDQRADRLTKLASLRHIIRVGNAGEGTDHYNPQIDVFSKDKEGERARIYQRWAVAKFADNEIAHDALTTFELAGDSNEEYAKKWTQLLEHISGVTAIADHITDLLADYGVRTVSRDQVEAAAIYDNMDKAMAVETAALIHDIEKPAELAAGAGGFENSLDNPVLRDGKLWKYLLEQGVPMEVIVAAQNTGRSDRLYSTDEEYRAVVDQAVESGRLEPEKRDEALASMLAKAKSQRESLAALLGVSVEEVETMTPSERRRASIEAKGPVAAIVAISDAMAAQFRFKGMSDEAIDEMSEYYLTRKTDAESTAFFGNDWPEYYKEVRRYLISLVPAEQQAALAHALETLTQERIFNETVLPTVVEGITPNPPSTEGLRYPEYHLQAVGEWTIAKAEQPEKNEDISYLDSEVMILADGATDKTGITYPSGKSGGKHLAEIAVETAKNSSKAGYELADEVTEAVRRFYHENNPDALTDASKRAASTLVVARLVGDSIKITQIGDTNIRIRFHDGTQKIFTNDKLVDTENADRRSRHITAELAAFEAEHGRAPSDEERRVIVASGRGVIQDRLNTQYQLQNSSSDATYGYGTIDGMTIPRTFDDGTPTNFVKEYEFDADTVASIELVSDGFYGEFPDESSERAYRQLYSQIHGEDPDKYLKYLSTKPKDDATVLIAKL